MAYRPKRLRPEHHVLVKQWASQGVSEKSMSSELGLSYRRWRELKETDAAAAEKIQVEARQQFEHWLGQGYAVTGFELTDQAGTYLLEPYAD